MTQVLVHEDARARSVAGGQALPPAGWYPDTTGGVWLRFWDGRHWAGDDPLRPVRSIESATATEVEVEVEATPSPAATVPVDAGPVTDDRRALPDAAAGQAVGRVGAWAQNAHLVLTASVAVAAGVVVAVLGILFTT